MKRLMIMLMLTAGAMTSPSIAFAAKGGDPGEPRFVEFCKSDTAGDPQFTLGDCVGFVATLLNGSPGLIPQACDFVRVVDPDYYDSVYSSYDECVRDKASQLPI